MKKFIIFFILFVMFLPCVNASEICKQELDRIAPNGVLKLNAVKPISNDYADVLWALGIKYDEDIISNIELRECNNSFDECYLYFYLNNGNSEVVSDSNYEQYKVNVQWAESNPKIQDFITDYVKELEDYSKNHTGNYDIGGPNTAGYELDDINNLKYWTHNPNFYNVSASTFGFNNIYESAFEYIPKFKDSFSNYNINIKFHGGSAGIKGKFLAHEVSAFSLWYKDVLYFASSTNYESDGYYVKNIAIAANDILYVSDGKGGGQYLLYIMIFYMYQMTLKIHLEHCWLLLRKELKQNCLVMILKLKLGEKFAICFITKILMIVLF